MHLLKAIRQFLTVWKEYGSNGKPPIASADNSGISPFNPYASAEWAGEGKVNLHLEGFNQRTLTNHIHLKLVSAAMATSPMVLLSALGSRVIWKQCTDVPEKLWQPTSMGNR